jgi:hypothetical protein
LAGSIDRSSNPSGSNVIMFVRIAGTRLTGPSPDLLAIGPNVSGISYR